MSNKTGNNTALSAAAAAYLKAQADRTKAVDAIYYEVAGMLKEAGLNAQVIIRGSNSFQTLVIEIRLDGDGPTLTAGHVEDTDPWGRPLCPARPAGPTGPRKEGELQE